MHSGFESFGLPPVLLGALERVGYKEPTAVQSAVIPVAMSGSDVLGSSQTGSGKTAAFMIPLLAKLLVGGGSGLVMAPTRELATQIYLFAGKLLGGQRDLSAVLLIGGSPMGKQFSDLGRKPSPRLIIGTPGRICDHMGRGSLNLSGVRFLVLDETDRMLDFGFSEQIEEIIECIPSKRCTMMFSATIPAHIVGLSKKYMVDPAIIKIGEVSTPAKNIKQEILHVDSHGDKYAKLLEELDKRDGSIIVFVKTKAGASDLAQRLSSSDHSVDCIHGDLRQSRRDRVIRGFRNRAYRIMIATDVASRGLDIPHIEHVINYDIPQCLEDYVHRIGRTARAGDSGSAVIFLTPGEKRKWNEIGNHVGMAVALPLGGNRGGSARGGRGRNNNGGPSSGGGRGTRYGVAGRYGGGRGGDKRRGGARAAADMAEN